jgi:hypothetical protein
MLAASKTAVFRNQYADASSCGQKMLIQGSDYPESRLRLLACLARYRALLYCTHIEPLRGPLRFRTPNSSERIRSCCRKSTLNLRS